MQKERAPLYERLVETARKRRARFHVPGHKGRGGLDGDRGSREHFQAIMDIDMTEIPGLDDLYHPEGAIREAQQLAADCFGAEETFFLVGGSTAGNIAMIMAACEPGELILMQRNVHKSAIHACMLTGCQIVFLNPRWDSESKLASVVSADTVREALRRYPQARAVFLTNPNYYGMGSDLRTIADVVHAYGIPLLIDEAHGAHYGFHPSVPASALSCGADAAVQSTHKMLTALTMGAMLHVQGDRLNRDILRQRLAMLQSSSPSYPIMASLDLSRRWMHTQGTAGIDRALGNISRFHDLCHERHIPIVTLQPAPTAAYETLDPFKLSVRAQAGAGVSGFELLERLEQCGCVPEMADPLHVVLALSPMTSEEELLRLADALEDIAQSGALTATPAQEHKEGSVINWLAREQTAGISPMPITIRMPSSRHVAAQERVTLNEAIGRPAAEMIVPYPPGIPIVYPGETITVSTAEQIHRLAQAGARFQGAADPTMRTVLIQL